MSTADRSVRLRLWLVLSIAFLALGAVAVVCVSRIAIQRFQDDYRKNLMSIGNLVAASIHAEQFVRVSDSRSTGEDHRDLMDRLGAMRSKVPGLRSINVLRPSKDGLVTVLSSSPNARTPYSTWILNSGPALTALSSGRVVPDMDLDTDRNGSYATIYAPILLEDQKPVGVVVLEKDASDLLARTAATRSGLAWSLVLVVCISLVFSMILIGYLAPAGASAVLIRRLGIGSGFFRGSLLEIMLATLASLVIASAAFGMLAQRDAEADALRSLSRVQGLDNVRTHVFNALVAGGTDPAGTRQLESLATSAGLHWRPPRERLGNEELIQLARLAGTELSRETETYAALRDAVSAKNQNLLAIFGIAAFLSMGALVLMRTARRQEHELVEARTNMARQEAAYKQIADNLPIGFYTYARGVIDSSNPAFDRLVGRESGESRWERFVERLHPEDKERVLEAFQRAEQDLNAFGLAFRMTSPEGAVRHVETRAVAVEDGQGGLQHIAGFLIDISSRVRAQRLLEDKNKEISATNDMLRKAIAEIEDNFEAMVHSLVKAVEAKDPYTAGHSERVMEYSLKIGERIGLSPEEMRTLKIGCLVHDIGKIGVPDAVLTKPSRLTDAEYEMIKQHPVLGYRMIERIPTFTECLPIVLHHHERLDGKGYPYGLKGLEIPLLVRIAAVADTFDAMTSDRAYRKGLDVEVVMEELFRSADEKILDIHIVAALAEVVREQGIISGATSASVA